MGIIYKNILSYKLNKVLVEVLNYLDLFKRESDWELGKIIIFR